MQPVSAIIPTWEKVLTFLVVVLPFLGFIVVVVPLWGFGVDAVSLSLFLVRWKLTKLGITVGFHRAFTHNSFKICRPWLKYALGILGSMAWEGSLCTWVSWHLKHHSKSDRIGDPHSPHLHEPGFWGFVKGLIHSHVGWMFVEPMSKVRAIKHFRGDPDLLLIDKLFLFFGLAGLVLPVALGALIRWTFDWMLVDFLWTLASVFMLQTDSWSVNSFAHIWGKQQFETGDESRNNAVVAAMAFGEGWHNGHHAFPRSARHGLLPRQLDLSWEVIRLLKRLGWVTAVNEPDNKDVQRRLKAV